MGRDEQVDDDGYAEQEPDDVARQLTAAAQLFAKILGRLSPDDWGGSYGAFRHTQRLERLRQLHGKSIRSGQILDQLLTVTRLGQPMVYGLE